MMPTTKTHLALLAVAGLGCLSAEFNPGQAQTWEEITANAPEAFTAEQFYPIASDGTRLYVLGAHGVLVSSDGGDSFTTVNAVSGGVPDLTEQSLRMVKFVNGELWISGSGVTDTPGLLGARLHRMPPGGTVWEPSDAGIPTRVGNVDDLVYEPVSATYFATTSTGEVYASADGGANWELRNSGLGGIGSPSSVVALDGAVLTSRPLGAVFRTTDQGANWSRSLGESGSPGTMIEHRGRLLFTLDRSLYFSDDAGLTWVEIPSVPHGASVMKSDGDLVLAFSRNNTATEALAYSATDGLSWHLLPKDGLPVRDPWYIAEGYHPKSLFRLGDQVFLLGETMNSSYQHVTGRLHRLDVSAFDFVDDLEIAVQPTGVGLLVGQSHLLQVYAAGREVSYQWRKNGEDIPGATARTYLIDEAELGDTGDYTVSVSNGGDPVLSAVATVTVLERTDGGWDPTFDQTDIGDGGKVHLRPDGGAIVVRSGATPLRIYSIGPEGGRLDSYSENTASANSLSNSFIDEEGRIVIGYKNSSSSTVVRRYESEDFDFIGSLVLGPSGTAERVQDMIEIPGEGYLVVGTFSTAGGVERKNIALIGYDNVVVPDFPEGSGPDSSLNSVTLAADGNIYAVGPTLSAWGGVNIGRMARISPGGQVTAGASGLPTGYFTFVHALKDGRLLARYVTGGSPYLYALNPDGTRDASFNIANHTIPDIRDVAQQADGKIIIVGNFNAFDGVPVAGYVRLNLDGTVDESFQSATGFSHGVIDNVTYDPRGYLYLSSTSGSSGSTFQGFGSVGRGPVRVFATPAESEPGGDTFADWPALATLPAGQRGPDATPAGDGAKNIVKYALGVLPLESAAARLPVETTVEDGGQTYPAVTFIRSRNAPGVSIVVDAASTVEFADDLGTTTVGVEDLGDGTERVTIRSNTSADAQGLQFFRINVTQP